MSGQSARAAGSPSGLSRRCVPSKGTLPAVVAASSAVLPVRAHTGRRRNEQARQAVLNAARRQLHTRPYRDVTIESIVREAHVGKQTVYRWWPSRAAVIMDALREDALQLVAPEQRHGRLARQLDKFLRDTVSGITGAGDDHGAGPALRAMMAEAQADPDTRAQFCDGFTAARRADLRQLLQSGVDQSELPATTDLDLLTDMAYGTIWYRLLLDHAPLDAPFATELASHLIAAAGDGGL